MDYQKGFLTVGMKEAIREAERISSMCKPLIQPYNNISANLDTMRVAMQNSEIKEMINSFQINQLINITDRLSERIELILESMLKSYKKILSNATEDLALQL